MNNQYLTEYLGKVKNHNTKVAYKKDIEQLLEFCNKEVGNITETDLFRWVENLRDLSSATKARKIIAVRQFFKYVKGMGYIETNPTLELKAGTVKNKEADYVTKEEVQRMIEVSTNIMHKALISFMMYTGLRVSEIIRTKVEDGKQGKFKVTTKGDNTRFVVLNQDTQEYVNKYLEHRPSTEVKNLFVNEYGLPLSQKIITRILQDAAFKAGIHKHITPHSMRHTFITMLCESHGIVIAQKVVGHKNLATTQRYVHMTEDKIENIMKGL